MEARRILHWSRNSLDTFSQLSRSPANKEPTHNWLPHTVAAETAGTAMTVSPAAPALAAAAAASAAKCPSTPVVNSKAGRPADSDAAAATTNSLRAPTAETENSSWLVNTPERRPSRYGGVPFDVAQSAITASRSGASIRGGGGFGGSSRRSRHRGNEKIDHRGDGATAAKSGGGEERPSWDESESAPLSSLKQLLDGLEGRCREAGGSGSNSRSVFGGSASVSGRRASWSLTSSTSRRRRRSSSSGGSSIVRHQAGGSGRSAGSNSGGVGEGADNIGIGGGGDGGRGVGLVSANKRSAAKRARGEGGAAGVVAAVPSAMPLANADGLMSPPSPAVTKVLRMKKSKRRT